MLNGVSNAVSFGCTYCATPKVHKADIPFEQAQSKDDWVSGYNAAIKQLGDFAMLQTQIAGRLAEHGVYNTNPEDYVPTPEPTEYIESPFNA